jgi:hypothetical protein
MQPCPDGDLGSSLPISLDGTTRGALNTQGGSCGGSSGPERVYRFTVPSTSMYFIDVMGMDFDTTLTILDGTCGGPEIACNDDGGPGSQIVLELTAGQVIMIVVDAYGSGSGAFTLTIDNTPY